ncbi:MAG: MG2 domain-containing protein [Bryobacteraceae bacterium]|nr:MG2 domain-containing protein [Bryobacteraceae bacterium]
MRRLAVPAVLFLALIVAPAIAQRDEAGTFFTLSTDRTYGSGEKPKVRLSGTGFRKLQFRVYKVRDPLRFFRELEDPNQFGGQSHRPPQALTVLEKWHGWKHQSRTALRNIVRRQYTQPNRIAIRDSLLRTSEPAPVAKGTTPAVTEYAAVPVLNQQQLVSTWEQPHQVANPWESSQVPVDVKEPGVYLVEATDGKLQAYTIVCVSDLILITKTGEGEIMARVVDRKTGQPRPDVEVVGWMNRQEVVRSKSDASGFAAVKLTAAPNTTPTPEGVDRSLMLLAHKGPDIAPIAINEWQLRQSDAAQSVTAYAYTDRPVYRPGHDVHFRAVLRRQRSLSWELPPNTPVNVVVEDPEGKTVVNKSLTPNAAGTIHSDLTLSPTAPLGYYSLSVRSGENYIGNTGFHVEEYRKPEYEVRVTTSTPRVLQGDIVKATINARYYFGEPVPGAKLKYVVHRSRYWLPWYEEEGADEQPSEEGEQYMGNEQVLEESGQLDANGNLNIEFPAEKAKHDLRYRIEARVTDEAGREISGAGWAIATRARFYVHAEPDKYVYDSGEQARIKVETKDYDGNPVGNLPFTVELQRKDQTVATASGRTDASGNGSATVKVTGGSLHAEVTAKDNDGREASDTAYLWVGGGGWDWGRQQRVDIIPDKKSYKAGETAKLLIVTGVPQASLWITAESKGIVFTKLIDAKSPTVTMELPIEAGYVPNIYVNATFVRDGQSFQGSKSLRVPPVEQKLDVSVKPSKSQFKPGEKGQYTIEAKDSTGRPVAAEFSLGVVDEAIYAIHRESTQDMTQFFYGRRYSSVQTTTSINYNFYGSSGKRRMQLTALRTDRRAQIKPEKFVDPRVRKAFPDTIQWIADVRTNAQGRAEVPVEYPDSLTTWRATARGITADTRVGSAVERTIVRKNLILRLTAPRFFMQGDEMTVAAIVQNYLATEKTVRVSLEAKGVELIDGGTRDITVPSRGVQQVLYRLKATAPGQAVLLSKALTDEESDAMELTIPVNPYGVKQSQSRSGVIDSGDAAEAQLAFPTESNPASRIVEITVSPSVAGTLFSALDYLITFPYGCTEQTMSSFLPNVIVSQATKALNIKANIDEADLVRKTRAGIERLYSYQHEDGGWGWWQADDSSPFMTAYVVAGLGQAKAAGYQIKDDALSKAIEWLKAELPKQKKQPAPDLRAYVAYALATAGQPDPVLTDAVWEKRDKLSPYGVALLGLAVSDPTRKTELASRLQSDAKTSDVEVYWEMKDDPLLEIGVNTNAEATAFALKFLSAQAPDSPLLPKAAFYLMSHRNQGYYWSSTKQTAMVIFGLTDYLKVSKELQPDFTSTVTLNGTPLGSKQFNSPEPWTLKVPGDQAANVRVTKSGKGRLYWSAQTNYYNTADKISSTGSGSLAITREYFRLVPEKKGDKVVHTLTPLGDTVQKGDIIAVRLVVKGSDWNYVITEDPIPAGTEFIPRDDLYELTEKPKWWARWFSRREFHDDRMALFQHWFPKGESEQSYLLKVVNAGRFRIPPARVEPMYQPGIFATSDSRTLEVR